MASDDPNIFQRKWRGFKYVFKDKELRIITIVAFACVLSLQAIRWLVAWIPYADFLVYWGFACLATFSYLFLFWVFFNLTVLFGAFRGKRRDRVQNHKVMWGIRVATVASMLLIYVVFPDFWKPSMYVLLYACFVVWGTIESVFFALLAYEASRNLRHAAIRALVFVLVAAVYGVYAYFMWQSARAGTPTTPSELLPIEGVDENLFDLIVMLVLFYFGFASMGERFLPKNAKKGGSEVPEFERLRPSAEIKLRNAVLVVFFLAIGDLIFLRGFRFYFTSTAEFPFVGDEGYYLVKFVTLLAAALVFLVVVLVKGPKGRATKRRPKKRG